MSLGKEWLLLAVSLLSLVYWLSGPGQLERINSLVQDTVSWLHQPKASSHIIIIAIDDASISAIGRWPWRRALHAGLIEHLSAAQPRAVGLDVVFSEDDWDYPADDWLLAQALLHNGRVVLPVVRSEGLTSSQATAPLPSLREAVAALGHTQLAVDADGVVRSFYALEGPASNPWWHMAQALQCVGRTGHGCAPAHLPESEAASSRWIRAQHSIVAFAHAHADHDREWSSPFTTYSYIDVLRGNIPNAVFRDKYVLVGTTASGLGEKLSAPLSIGTRPISSIEMLAHVLNGNLQGQHLRASSATLDRILNLTPVLLALLALAWVGPSGGMLACVLLTLISLLLAGLAPRLWLIQTAPAAGLVDLAVAYPLWSWLRLRAAASFLQLELQDLQGQGLPAMPNTPRRGDLMDHRITAVEQASRQLRSLHHFVSESLRQLPSPTFVCDRQGWVLLTNTTAHAYAQARGWKLQIGDSLPQLLKDLKTPATDTTPPQILLSSATLEGGSLPRHSEVQDAQGHSLIVLAQPFDAPPTQGWLITLVDISELRSAQNQRDQAMQFISHDIRAPISSIITLLEMQRHAPHTSEATRTALLSRIEGYALSSLQLADDFVHLSRAQQQVIRRTCLDLGHLLEQAIDQCWPQATANQIQLLSMPLEQEAEILGDAGLLQRAIVNLISNAIKYGHPTDPKQPAVVECMLHDEGQHWRLTIRDHGPGMDAQSVARLSRPFERLEQHHGMDGVGLGLALSRTVAMRHGGQLEISSIQGKGSCFSLLLPQASTQQEDPEHRTEAVPKEKP